MWSIEVEEEGKSPWIVRLNSGEQLRVGRSPKCDICINNPGVSRNQMIIKADAGTVEVTLDENASAKVSCAGEVIRPGVSLRLDSETSLQIASVKLRIVKRNGENVSAHLPADPETPLQTEALGAKTQEDRSPGETGHLYEDKGKEVQATHTMIEGPSQWHEEPPSAQVDSSGTEATFGRPETMATRGLSGNAEEFPGVGGETSYLSEDDAREILEQYASRRRKRLLSWGGALLAILLLYVLLARQGPPAGPPPIHEGTFYSISLPRGWATQSKGEILLFSASRPERGGIVVIRGGGDEVWAYDYASVFLAVTSALTDAFSHLEAVEWEMWSERGGLPSLHLPAGGSIPYVSRQGRINQNGQVLARLYVAQNTYVGLISWNVSRNLSLDTLGVMDSFHIKPQQISPDYVYRDIRWQTPNTEGAAVRQYLQEADYLFSQRHASMGNAWRAYSKALDMLRTLTHSTDTGSDRAIIDLNADGLASVKTVWSPHLTTYSKYIQAEYGARRSLIIAAQAAGHHARAKKLAEEIQELIPDRRDPRWVWAQRAYAESDAQTGTRRGFF